MRKSIMIKGSRPCWCWPGVDGCGTSGEPGDSGHTVTGLRMMVPNTPGSGYDLGTHPRHRTALTRLHRGYG
jgi:hypothetical protein